MTKVLLVEDDNNLREIYEARLSAEGFEISTATDGEDALAVAKQIKPDLIISDVMMPRISGFEMLDILRNTDGLKETKIIMLTALGQAEDKTRADTLGADRYLVKSQVTLEDIVKAADELLNPDKYPEESNASSGNTTPPTPPAGPAATPPAMTPPEPPAPPAPDPAPQMQPTPPTEPMVAVPAEPAMAPQPTMPEPQTMTPSVPPAEPAMTPQPTAQPEPNMAAGSDAAAPMTPQTPGDDVPTMDPTAMMPAPSGPSTPASEPDMPADTQSTSQEAAAVEQQINQFAAAPAAETLAAEPAPDEPAPAPESTTPMTTPEPAMTPQPMAQPDPSTTPTDPSTAIPIPPPMEAIPAPEQPDAQPPASTQQNLIANAANDLSSGQSGAPDNNSPAVAGKKIISPPTPDESKPDLHTLLAQEQAKEVETSGAGQAYVVPDATKPPAAPAPQPTTPPSTEATKGVFTPNENGNADTNAL